MGKFGPTYMGTSGVITLIVIVLACIPLLIFNEWLKETTGFPIWVWILIIIFAVILLRDVIEKVAAYIKKIDEKVKNKN